MSSSVCRTAARMVHSLLTFLVGIVCLAAAAWLVLPNLIVPSTNLAVINARLVTVRSPIAGAVVSSSRQEGTFVRAGDVVYRVANPQPERRYLVSLAGELKALRSRVAALEAQDRHVKEIQESTQAQAKLYGTIYTDRLDLQIFQARHQAWASSSRLKISEMEQKLTEQLALQQAAASKDKPQADLLLAVAQAEQGQTQSHVEMLKRERAAADKGIFLGTSDGRPGIPYFTQRLEELALIRLDLQSRLAENRARVSETEEQVASEEKQLEGKESRDVACPTAGLLYRKMVLVGQHVKENSDLAHLVNPQEIFVEAIVGAREFRKIELDDIVRVRLEGATTSIRGKVTRKLGALLKRDKDVLVADLVSGNKEGDYRVWIVLDHLPAAARPDNAFLLGCKVQVRFGDDWFARGMESDE